MSEIYIHPQRRILIPSLTHGRFLLAGIYVTSTRSCYFRGSFLRLATRKLFTILGMHVGVTDAREFQPAKVVLDSTDKSEIFLYKSLTKHIEVLVDAE